MVTKVSVSNKFKNKVFKIEKSAKTHVKKVMKRNDSLLKRLRDL